MIECRECGRPVIGGTARKEFCDDYCRGAYHRRRYRQQKVEEAEDQRQNGAGFRSPQEATKALAGIVEGMRPRFVRRI